MAAEMPTPRALIGDQWVHDNSRTTMIKHYIDGRYVVWGDEEPPSADEILDYIENVINGAKLDHAFIEFQKSNADRPESLLKCARTLAATKARLNKSTQPLPINDIIQQTLEAVIGSAEAIDLLDLADDYESFREKETFVQLY